MKSLKNAKPKIIASFKIIEQIYSNRIFRNYLKNIFNFASFKSPTRLKK